MKKILFVLSLLLIMTLMVTGTALAWQGEDDGDGGNAWGQGGVYCAEGKEESHPLAAKIAEDYGVDPAWVMEQACNGGGFGQVMLALQTQAVTGEEAGAVLEKVKNGKGWGNIWKEAGIVGSDHADVPPPGQLKKLEKSNGNGPPDDKGKPDDAGPPDDKGKPDDKGNNGKGSDKGNGSDKNNNNNSDDED